MKFGRLTENKETSVLISDEDQLDHILKTNLQIEIHLGLLSGKRSSLLLLTRGIRQGMI